MGRDELVLKIPSDPLKNHKRDFSNCSTAKISMSPTSPKLQNTSPIVLYTSKPNSHEPSTELLSPIDDGSMLNLSSEVGGSRNVAYGSFSNTSPDKFDSECETHDIEVPLGDENTSHKSARSYQWQPLLHNPSDSSSEDENAGTSFSRRKTQRVSHSHTIDIQSRLGDEEDIDGSERPIGSDPLKTLLAFFFLVVAWIATTTSLALTHERVPDDDPLPDLFLDNVTYQSWGLDTSEIIIIVCTWIAFLVVLFHKQRFIIFRRLFFLVGIHYYYRAITMYITVLPKADPHYKCAPKLNVTTSLEIAQRVLRLLSGMGLSINGQHIYCGDYIYSGHAMTLIMTCLTIKQYAPPNWFLLKALSFILTVAGIIFLLMGRGHYSIDVLIAYFITTRLWWMYHTLAENTLYRTRSESNYLGKSWWFHIFRYLEVNVPAKSLSNEYNWPVPTKVLHWFRSRTCSGTSSSQLPS